MMMVSFSSLQSISIFPINPKISLCTFSIKNNLSNEWEISTRIKWIKTAVQSVSDPDCGARSHANKFPFPAQFSGLKGLPEKMKPAHASG